MTFKHGLFSLALGLATVAIPFCSVKATVTDTDTQTVTAVGNGVTTNYTIGFSFQDNDDVLVYREDVSVTPYVRTLISQGVGATKFTITGGDPGTTVVMGTAPTSSQRLVIKRSMSFTQTVDYVDTEAFPADSHERAMDKQIMLLQQLNADLSSKIGLSTTSYTTPTFPDPVANKFLAYNTSGTDLTLLPATGTPVSGSILKHNGTAWALFDLDTAIAASSSALTNSYFFVGNSSNVATGVAMSGDVSLSNTGAVTITTGAVSSAKILDGTIANVDLSSYAAIARTKIGTSTANYVVINDANGVLGQEQRLATSRGGTGQDLSASTGLAKFSSGTASVSTLVNADVSASAAIDRSKLANGTAFGVVVNDASGIMSSVAPSTSGNVLTSDGTSWVSSAGSASPTSSYELSNVGISATISSNTLVLGIKQSDGTTNCASGAAACKIGFRSGTSTVGGYTQVSVTGASTVTLAAVDSIGIPTGAARVLYPYAISDTTVDMCLSSSLLDEGTLQSAQPLTAGADTTAGTLYCNAAHTLKPIRRLGAIPVQYYNPNWSGVGPVKLNPSSVPQMAFGTITNGSGAACTASCSVERGDGANHSGSRASAGLYTVTFGIPFISTPTCTAGLINPGNPYSFTIVSVSTTAITVTNGRTATDTPADLMMTFDCKAQR